MNVYDVRQWLVPGPGRGHWYTCRQVEAPNRAAAVLLAFPNDGGSVPAGWRVVLI